MKSEKVVVLEPSTNTHVMKNENGILVHRITNSILKLKVQGDGIVNHGEHGTVKTESPDVIKYVQQELNPITKAIQNAFD